MSDNLPVFKYFPDPLSSGAVEPSSSICECCNQARGYICPIGIFSAQSVEFICPWCISDGSAARRFDGIFYTESMLEDKNLDSEIIKEVCERTPRFLSWNFDSWLAHCDDACEFHGDAQKEDLAHITPESLDVSLYYSGWSQADWQPLVEMYEPDSNPSIYKFKCRNCSLHIYLIDGT